MVSHPNEVGSGIAESICQLLDATALDPMPYNIRGAGSDVTDVRSNGSASDVADVGSGLIGARLDPLSDIVGSDIGDTGSDEAGSDFGDIGSDEGGSHHLGSERLSRFR